jgi:phosphoesterase RecJ-like protein
MVWATITEDVKNNQFRVSIRSRGPEINEIAEKHHGGGHKYASGVKAKTLEEAMDIMKDLDQELALYTQGDSEER